MILITPKINIEHLPVFAGEYDKLATQQFNRKTKKSFRDYAILYSELFNGSNILEVLYLSIIIKYESLEEIVVLSEYLQITHSKGKYLLGTGTIQSWLAVSVESPNKEFCWGLFNYLKIVAPIVTDYVIIKQRTITWKQ